MGRELRKVIPNWQHPRYTPKVTTDQRLMGRYIPLHDEDYESKITEWIKNHQLWQEGKYSDQDSDYKYYADYAGSPGSPDEFRPKWTAEEATWFQVYETVSEGTPVTPPFATKDELIQHLVNKGDDWGGPWSRQAAERFINDIGWAPSMVSTPEHGVQEGYEANI